MPYLKFRSREVLFREAVIAFTGADTDENGKACGPAQKERCRLEFGEFRDWACETCESNPLRKSNHA